MTKDEKKKYDWEATTFPVKISSLKSLTGHYNIPQEATLEVSRNEDYRLIGVLGGVMDNSDDLEYREGGEIIQEGFLEGEKVTGIDGSFNYTIEGLVIDSIRTSGMYTKEGKMKFPFSAQVRIDSIKQIYADNEPVSIFSEWYLCSIPQVSFANITKRYEDEGLKQYKVRTDIDPPVNNEKSEVKFQSSSWDFFVLNHKDYKIVVQQVPAEYLPNWSDGLAIEYRDLNSKIPPDEVRQMVRDFLSFMFGCYMEKIGESRYRENYQISTSKSFFFHRKRYKKENPMYPIPIQTNDGRDYFQDILNKLLPAFAEMYKKLTLSDCLWKLSVGKNQPMGANLPVLASGLEVLAESYLEANGIVSKYTRSERKKFHSLISAERNAIFEKIEGYKFRDSLMKRLENPFTPSIGEKIQLFFDSIGIDFDTKSIENRALLARNKMTHAKQEYKDRNDMQDIVKLSDAYITLINRIILKLIGYNGLYINYGRKGVRYTPIDQNM